MSVATLHPFVYRPYSGNDAVPTGGKVLACVDPADHRRGQDAIRSFKLLADWLLSQGYEPHRGESNAQFVGRVLRETIGKGGMP